MRPSAKIILVLLSLVLIGVGALAWQRFTSQWGDEFVDAIHLIRAGEYERGLEKCAALPYPRMSVTACHQYLFGEKIVRNESLTAEFCQKLIYHKEDFPFWWTKTQKKNEIQGGKQAYDFCMSRIE